MLKQSRASLPVGGRALFFWCSLLAALLLYCHNLEGSTAATTGSGTISTNAASTGAYDSVLIPHNQNQNSDLRKRSPLVRERDVNSGRDRAHLQGLTSPTAPESWGAGAGKQGWLTTTVKVPFHGFPPSQPQDGTRWSMSDYPKLVRHDTRQYFPAGDIFIQTLVPDGVFKEADDSEVLWHGVCPHGSECADDALLMHHLTLMYWSKDSYSNTIDFDKGHAHA